MFRKALIITSVILVPLAMYPTLGLLDTVTFFVSGLGVLSGILIQTTKFLMIASKPLKSWMERLMPLFILLSIIVFTTAEPRIRVPYEIATTFAYATGGYIALKTRRHRLATIFFLGTALSTFVLFVHLAAENILGRGLYFLDLYHPIYIYVAGIILVIEITLAIYFGRLQLEKDQRYNDLESENLWFTSTFGLVSHNLKTPLGNIQGQIEILRLLAARKKVLEEEELVARLDGMERSVHAAKSTLESVIDNYKALIQSLNQEKRTVKDLEVKLTEKYPGLKWEYSEAKIALEQLSMQGFFVFMLNLEVYIDNAVRYAGGLPKICISHNRVQIIDNGPGFPQELISDIGRNIVISQKGNGLGMYLAISLLRTVYWDLKITNTSNGAIVEMYEVKRI